MSFSCSHVQVTRGMSLLSLLSASVAMREQKVGCQAGPRSSKMSRRLNSDGTSTATKEKSNSLKLISASSKLKANMARVPCYLSFEYTLFEHGRNLDICEPPSTCKPSSGLTRMNHRIRPSTQNGVNNLPDILANGDTIKGPLICKKGSLCSNTYNAFTIPVTGGGVW